MLRFGTGFPIVAHALLRAEPALLSAPVALSRSRHFSCALPNRRFASRAVYPLSDFSDWLGATCGVGRLPWKNGDWLTTVPTLVEQAQLVRDMGWGEVTTDRFQGL
jgi:hypothetical protein